MNIGHNYMCDNGIAEYTGDTETLMLFRFKNLELQVPKTSGRLFLESVMPRVTKFMSALEFDRWLEKRHSWK